MDFALVYLLVAAVWWLAKVTFVIAGAFSIFVVLFVVRDVWRMLQSKKQRRNELH